MANKSGSAGTINGSSVRGSGVSIKPNKTEANRITNTSTMPVQAPKTVNAMSPTLTSPVTGNQMKSIPARFEPEYKEPEVEPISSFAPTGLASSTGSATTSEPVSIGDVGKAVDNSILSNFKKKASGLDVWEQQSAERENRPARTQNYFGEDYDLDGSDFNWIDSQQNYIGNTPTNDAYIRDMIASGKLSEDDAWAILHKPQSIAEGEEMRKSRPGISADVYNGTEETLDDGTGRYFNMTADAMTGTQYLHYRDDLGMGGRPGYIDPNKTYSKRREAVNYGFIPFMPDVSTYGSMVTQNLLDVPSRIGSAIGDIRHAITPDYKINYEEDGKQKSVSGDAFDESASAFMNQYYHDLKYDPDKYLSAPDNGDYTAFVNQFMVPDANGNETYHYGHLVDVSNTSDGLVQFAFSDGSTVKTTEDFFDSVYENGNVNLDYTPVPTQSVKGMVNLDEMRPGRHTAMVNEYVVPDAYGNETYHYGNLVSVDDGPNGTYRFTFEDGSSVDAPESYFNSVYDRNTGNVNVSYNKIFADDAKDEVVYDDEALKPTLKNSDILYLPNMTMSDGTKMRLPDVERLLFDKTPEDDANERGMSDDDVTYDFSGMGGDSPLSRDVPVVGPILNAVLGGVGKLPVLNGITNRPTRLGGQEIITKDENGNYSVDTSNLMNDAIDWTLGSIPISVPGILPYVYSLSNASRSFSGINPGSYNPRTDSYDLNAGTWDDNGNLRYGVYDLDKNGNEVRNDELSNSTRLWNAAGNAIVPVTEQIVGPIGEHNPLGELFGRATDKFTKKLPSYLGRALVNELVGAGEEGVEEILGNVPEDLTSYGTDMFADPIIDPETGEAMTDQFGHEMRRHDTDAGNRAWNYVSNLADNGNAFLGGALVDAVMRQIPTGQAENPSFWPTIGNAILKDRARLLTGVDPGEDIERPMTRDLGRRYASLFDDRGMVVNGEENG